MFDRIKKNIKEKNILIGVLVTVISTFVTELTISFINNLVIPIFDRDGDDDDKPDINHLNRYKLKYHGITFQTGAFLITFIKFIIVLIFISWIINNLE